MRKWFRDRLWGISDRLCALGLPPAANDHGRKGPYKITFELGHLIGEAGWKLRSPR